MIFFFRILNCYLNSVFDFVKGISMKEIQQVMENMQTSQNAKAKATKITTHWLKLYLAQAKIIRGKNYFKVFKNYTCAHIHTTESKRKNVAGKRDIY